MTTSDTVKAKDTKQECFLCALDPQPCTVTKLEGRIINAYEVNANGEKVPFITLDAGTSFVSLSLTRYYRSLVQGLLELGNDIRKSNLRLRIYHLPAANNITEHKGRKVYRYRANSYTLAILEPDTILNITDLNSAEYCARQYLLHRLASSPMSAAALRGNLVHYCFKELLKEHDRGKFTYDHANDQQEEPLSILYRHFAQALERSSIDLALMNVSSEAMREEVAPHLESLATWFQNQSRTLWDMSTTSVGQNEVPGEQQGENGVRAETFLLAPEIGLRGRLDLLWQQTSRQRLLELKTGGVKGELPRPAHLWQVRGYHALLTVRRDSKMKKAQATLLYSGTPEEAQAFDIPFTIKNLQRVNETRNILVLSHVTGFPPAPPGPSRCTKCSMLNTCQQVSFLLDWKPPVPDRDEGDSADSEGQAHRYQKDRSEDNGSGVNQHKGGGYNELRPYIEYAIEDREFFAKYYRLLQLEGREGEGQQALLWKEKVEERMKRGVAIRDLQLEDLVSTEQGEWLYTFRCKNESELRQDDEILLSNGDPITGEVVTGTIISIGATEVKVWTPERISNPALIDRYDTDIVHVRTLQNLLRWLQADVRLRRLVAGMLRPGFDNTEIPLRARLNEQQNLAVRRAMQMQDYLLIHGPPGTGKTSVIAEIVKLLCQQGQRVMLAAFTNQAVDNMLKRLQAEGFSQYVRLGHERSVDDEVRERLLQRLVETARHGNAVREVLQAMPVVASTAATWSSDKYSPLIVGGAENSLQDSCLQFDVAIIDEAGQLTVPAILGALRFAKRFILVGDEKQLPPLVLSKQAADFGLSDSLFSMLKQLDNDYTKNIAQEGSACVALTVQYRMNKTICDFASQMFYERKLKPHVSVAQRLLEVAPEVGQVRMEAASIMQAVNPRWPLVFLDVRTWDADDGVKISNAEARTVREVVSGLLARGVAPRDIGIIAPYRAQVANLRRHLVNEVEVERWQNGQGIDLAEMSIDTVDRFQGGERQVIIISFATTTVPEAESQLREHLTNSNRLNVALTRAQRKLILVGCALALTELPVFRELLEYCRKMQTVIAHVPAPAPATLR